MGWDSGRRRRQALAARISLLSRVTVQAETVKASVEPDPPAEPPSATIAPEESKPDEVPPAPRPKRQPRSALDLKDASGLFAALGTSDNSELSDQDAGDGSGFGYELSNPEKEEKEKQKRELPDQDDPEAKQRNLRELPDQDQNSNAKPKAEPKPQATMTDLSLAILTGSFAAPSDEVSEGSKGQDALPDMPQSMGLSADTDTEEDPEFEATQEIGAEALETPPKPLAMADLQALSALMAEIDAADEQ